MVSTEKGTQVLEKPDPWELLVDAVEMINEHSETIHIMTNDAELQKKMLSEILRQNQMLVKNIKVMNQTIKLINQRLANLESKNETQQTTTNNSQ
jgi:mevalonate kinase